ncbi:hypothetical protein KPL74_05520 [Bacillus sp. NP157]|nr:hypothetical protein KPL74_05520 [Bacillus sp. NP157]
MTPSLVRYATPLAALLPALASADPARDVPNFTGPLATPAVNTLPQGVLNIEPYLIHTNARGSYDNARSRHGDRWTTRQWQVALPMAYGLSDTTNVQLTLNAMRTSTRSGHTDGLRMGDSAVRLQQRLSGPGDQGTAWVSAVSVTQRIPTGDYHHLGANPLNGTGNGTARTTLSVGAQKLQWLANDHALRWRGQLAWGPSPGRVSVRGRSVYGTEQGFRGTARPGQAWNSSLAAEYVLDSRWVLVGEAIWNHLGSTAMRGVTYGRVRAWRSRPSSDLSLAPAVEYHVGPSLGLIAGVQFTVAGRNATSYVAPQVAVNMVL